MAIRDNKDYIRVLLYSYYTTITGWGGPPKRYIVFSRSAQHRARHVATWQMPYIRPRPPHSILKVEAATWQMPYILPRPSQANKVMAQTNSKGPKRAILLHTVGVLTMAQKPKQSPQRNCIFLGVPKPTHLRILPVHCLQSHESMYFGVQVNPDLSSWLSDH